MPHDELMTTTRELATKIAKGPPIAIRLAKRALRKSMEEVNLESQMDYELYMNRICLQTEDFKEGVSSFLEKREAVFKGQ